MTKEELIGALRWEAATEPRLVHLLVDFVVAYIEDAVPTSEKREAIRYLEAVVIELRKSRANRESHDSALPEAE